MRRSRTSARRWPAALALAATAAASFAGVAVISALAQPGGTPRTAGHQAGDKATRASGSSAVARAARTLRGLRGRRGERGPRGPLGFAGNQPVVKQNVTLNWQNGAWQGRERQFFGVPGIGYGEVVCSPDTQWIRVFPTDLGTSTVMWTLKTQNDGQVHVKKAGHESPDYGPDYNEGMNRYAGEPTSIGSFIGIFSSRLGFAEPGGPGPAPTTFRLAWHWDFSDSASSRCYVAASFVSGAV
jgi:hypothetical protein